MKLEQYINKAYRFSSLKEVGTSGAISVIILVAFGIFALTLPPTGNTIKTQQDGDRSYLSVDAIHVKKDDAYFHEFMKRLKKNGDVLVLGTSESGFMDSYNYWELLNADSTITERFGVLYGAGRSCERYIPSMLNSPEIWRGQQLLILVNPVYWRDGLSSFNDQYHTRYMDDGEVRKARLKSKRKEDFDILFGGGRKGVVKEQMNALNQFVDHNIHELYYGRLHHFFGLEQEETRHFIAHLDYVETQKLVTAEKQKELQAEILPDYNCTQECINKNDHIMETVQSKANYRNTAMDYFMDLSKELEMNVTFVLGPYNNILAKQNGQTDVIEQFEALEDQLRNTFKKEGFNYIDATDISIIQGSFIDKQHHSKYGGYLLYQHIKENLYE